MLEAHHDSPVTQLRGVINAEAGRLTAQGSAGAMSAPLTDVPDIEAVASACQVSIGLVVRGLRQARTVRSPVY